jgi:hypothetical protein
VIPDSFDALYGRLARAAEAYHSVERSPDCVTTLAHAYWELHLARRAIADERSRLESSAAIYTAHDRRWLDRVGIDS